MKMEEGCPVGKDGVDIDLLNVRQVGHRVHGKLEVADMFDGTVLRVNAWKFKVEPNISILFKHV